VSAEAKPTVAIVDDDDMIRAFLRVILREFGLNVVCEARTLREAKARVAAKAPNLVFLDIHLPGGSGLEALAGLREESPSSRFIMLTSDSTPDNVKAAVEDGARGFVVKPFTADSVLAAIQRAAK
jgi:DNA-binding NarL/FixJ family response regulator